MEINQPHIAPDKSHSSLRDEHNFEVTFDVPATHRLVLVRSRSQGCPLTAIFWEHDQYDVLGRLVARYRSFEQMTPAGETRRGWRKFDSYGHIVSEDDDLL